ncbi:helix-hairpin-helix domain-containing protein [Rhodococcus xishaensis]|uniref:ComEA family DNA-binding protein n=1 Tax=Rhodococcus xishaensis TaxID=2487364 RepID=A0A438B3G4_9NOCA|nr:helix-hairpin-helix domain-containing protein [Rhodococcus xishaensis]RVW05525.1 ComEA family DNA-binding protein [Rhodococcus xishaensis]
MGTDQDRARARSRLAVASAGSAPTPKGHHHETDDLDAGDTSMWVPEWLSGTDAAFDEADRWPETSRWSGPRLSPGRRGAAALVVVGLVAAGIAAVSVWRDRPTAQAVPPLPIVEVRDAEAVPDGGAAPAGTSTSPSAPPSPSTTPPPDEHLVVSVVGLVNHAGLVLLPPGSRVADALEAAGGPRPGADLLGLNMAERVHDGDQILVGVVPPDGGPSPVGSAHVGAGTASGTAIGAQARRVGKINLNTAAETELDALPGVGPVTAAAIVSWRQTNGRFTDVEQLSEVDGIGPARLAKLRDLVML